MGELEKSLEDAEASLQGDPTFCKVTDYLGGGTTSRFSHCHDLQPLMVKEPARLPGVYCCFPS